MATYHAPLRDMRFVLHELLEVEREFASLPGFEETNAELTDAILEEAAKLCEQVIFPTNRTGDEEGCVFDSGEVRTPSGFRAAYDALVEGGWPALACDPVYGGQGLPETLKFCVEEMLCSANVAFSLYPGLTHGAYRALLAHGTDELKAKFLPKMVQGTWTGSMCLTESHSGSDLSILRTRAVPQGDDTYRITGTKIFITSGEHDLSENIIHLVLARLPDAPLGTKGISLFLVPKFLLNTDGTLGQRNGVHCGALERKMGIKGSSTCVLNFEDAEGYLVGEPHHGLPAMFTMMNHDRLTIGIQGLGLAEVAYQSATEYARERLQGRSSSGPKAPDKEADPILVHPDVRRMLLKARAYNEGGRALASWIALKIDIAHRHPDPAKREEADDLVALLTPVIKAFFTDYGSEACNECLQVLGGHGYITEWGMEQFVRDARIAQIYEGTNGIQALDLVRRKIFMHNGRLTQRYLATLEAFLDDNQGDPAMESVLAPLGSAFATLQATTAWLKAEAKRDPEALGSAASDYLRLLALVTLAYLWARIAKVAVPHTKGPEAAFYRAKLATANFYMKRLLPQVMTLAEVIVSGSESLMALEADAF